MLDTTRKTEPKETHDMKTRERIRLRRENQNELNNAIEKTKANRLTRKPKGEQTDKSHRMKRKPRERERRKIRFLPDD